MPPRKKRGKLSPLQTVFNRFSEFVENTGVRPESGAAEHSSGLIVANDRVSAILTKAIRPSGHKRQPLRKRAAA